MNVAFLNVSIVVEAETAHAASQQLDGALRATCESWSSDRYRIDDEEDNRDTMELRGEQGGE